MKERLIGQETIPLPSNKLILIDLDKTLIDTKYQLTDKSILNEIKRVQSLGWKLGLSSDTPLEPLKMWSQKFGLNGPIIAEKGSVLWSPETGEVVLSKSENFFTDLKHSLINDLIKMKIPFLHGDATQFIRNNPKLSEVVDQRIVVINAYRKCSLSFFSRKIDERGFMEIDNPFAQEIATATRGLWSSSTLNLEEDFNPEYGIYILAPKEVTKRKGTLKLIEKMSFSKIGIIGDSSSDIVGSDIAFHYAVGNAKPELKLYSDYVAGEDYTRGVIEILKKIKF